MMVKILFIREDNNAWMLACTAVLIGLSATKQLGTRLMKERVRALGGNGWLKDLREACFLKLAYPIKLSGHIAKGQEERGKGDAEGFHRVTGIQMVLCCPI
jgi:hypothetical protein